MALPFLRPSTTKEGKSTEKQRITKDTNLDQLAREYPAAADFLQEEYGLHCIGCFANSFDTLETGMRVHGYGEGDIHEAIEAVNKLLEI